MFGVKPVPARVVLAGVFGVGDPFDAANGYDVATLLQEWCGLPGMRPISIEQQPGWRQPLEMPDHWMKDLARPRRIGYDCVTIQTHDVERIMASLDIAVIDAL